MKDRQPRSKACWASLEHHAARLATIRTHRLFDDDAARFDRLSFTCDGLFADFSKNRVDGPAMDALVALARDRGLETWRDAMFRGEVVNTSEQRPALHAALRDKNGPGLRIGGVDIHGTVRQSLRQVERISEDLRNKTWPGATGKPITDVIHIGIGGSILGPATAVHALKTAPGTHPEIHFVSNVDAAALTPVLNKLSPETTLVIIVSKSFTTLETLTNGASAREWLLSSMSEDALRHHLVAVTANQDMAHKFGVVADNTLALWDWVGGRFSLWSAVGLPVAISAGMDRFNRLLDGAARMDAHFRNTPLERNIPVLLALIGIWNTNFQHISAHAILPYDDRLDGLPAHIQQLEMESTGKSVDRHGHPVIRKTAPIVFGMSGTDAQHTFFQAVHQGTHAVSADFIGCLRNDYDSGLHHQQLLANMVAQSEALMLGWSAADEEGHEERVCPGNRPSTTILLDSLNPENLGLLLALYEHKVFIQGVIWGVNPFDQWGVELGKKLTATILEELAAVDEAAGDRAAGDRIRIAAHDSSTSGLLNRFIQSRAKSQALK